MTKEEIILMARQTLSRDKIGFWAASMTDLEDFAALVAAKAVQETSAEYRMGWNDGQINEREACAKVCDWYVDYSSNPMNFAENCAQEIRARSKNGV